MRPNLFPLIRASASLQALLGTDPMRFFPHGRVPQGTTGDYVTHRGVGQVPENALDEPARVDGARIQVSAWSATASGAGALHDALRAVLEEHFDVLDVRDMGVDPETNRYRWDLDVLVWVHRETDSSS